MRTPKLHAFVVQGPPFTIPRSLVHSDTISNTGAVASGRSWEQAQAVGLCGPLQGHSRKHLMRTAIAIEFLRCCDYSSSSNEQQPHNGSNGNAALTSATIVAGGSGETAGTAGDAATGKLAA